ncbi:hypothetical protein [Crocosphaera sp. XPORK-15E]|uniref:hypothetical protein n=1 Tax=Crocosphaera sp. XPORK-15E TaxID=3110247 RepID=UPI002B1F1F39|nr:hypothetical protein [Crocosphaera sp. XPORK-15E]MEA5534731.1 hypothetical protein [Crocosphaera sp. XPORK-15E]
MTKSSQNPQGIFAPYMQHYGQIPSEQLNKNQPLMERLKKWIEETEAEKITEEEAKAREQQWEEFKEIIDSFRPAGHKLYKEE